MKKFCLAAFLFGMGSVFFISCEKGETKSPETDFTDIESTLATVGYEEACRDAQIAVEILESGLVSQPSIRSSCNFKAYPYFSQQTRSEQPTRVPLFYFFDLDNGGIAVVATDRRAGGLLVAMDNERDASRGYLMSSGVIGSGAGLYLNALSSYLEALSAVPNQVASVSEPGRIQIRKRVIANEVVNPKVPVAWGEGSPYNLYCKLANGVKAQAGAAATAVAQTMAAYSYPKTIQFTYPDADVASVALNWPGIKEHFNTPNCEYTCTEHQTTGRIFREIGQQLGMKYDKIPNKSTTDFENIPGCFHHFGFTADPVSDYSYWTIGESLLHGKMVCMTGKAVENSKTYEHVWLVDGFQNVETATEIWFLPDNGGPSRLIDTGTQKVQYTHCNWGFDGVCNGYFNMNVFNMSDPEKPDEGSLVEPKYNFTENLRIITGIAPANN